MDIGWRDVGSMEGREEGFDFGIQGPKMDLKDMDYVCLDLDG